MKMDEILQLQVLKLKAVQSGRLPGRLMDQVLEQTGETLQLRQMCAKVSAELYSDLENVCGLLDMTKREFIEGAVSDALDRAKDMIARSGVLEREQQGEL